MKLLYKLTITILIVGTVACSKDDPASPKTKVSKLLIDGPWNIETVLVDNVDLTQDFEGMALTFSETTYVTTNGGLVWPASGTWSFTTNKGDEILRDGDLLMSISQINQDALVLEFDWDGTLGAGRTRSVEGNYKFTFSR